MHNVRPLSHRPQCLHAIDGMNGDICCRQAFVSGHRGGAAGAPGALAARHARPLAVRARRRAGAGRLPQPRQRTRSLPAVGPTPESTVSRDLV